MKYYPKKITFQFQYIMMKLKGRLNILIMCHGKYNISLIKDCDIATFDNMLNLNVRSTFHFLSLSIPFLKLSKGNVVILSSLESRYQIKYGFLNSMTKSKINSLIECCALELAPFGVRINGIAPGITNTNHRIGETLSVEDNNIYIKKFYIKRNSFNLKILLERNWLKKIIKRISKKSFENIIYEQINCFYSYVKFFFSLLFFILIINLL